MAEKNTNRLGLSRLLAEGVVVLASILIAFALDDWWDDRQLQAEMAGDLEAIQSLLHEEMED